uniref:Uncharacterized protein n=1 Tax=Echinococcus canadensis TaxID=519352 RepID=A0A915EUC4_9CEST
MWIKQGSYYGEKINVQEQMRISDIIIIALYYVFIVNGLLKQNYSIKKCPYRPKLITDFAILPQKPNNLHELEILLEEKLKLTVERKLSEFPTNPSLHLKPYLSLVLCGVCLSRGVSEIFSPPDCKVSSRNTHLTVSEERTQALLIEECCVTPSSIVKNKVLNILFGGLTVLLLKELFNEQIFLVPQKYPEFPPRCEHPPMGLSTTKLSFSGSQSDFKSYFLVSLCGHLPSMEQNRSIQLTKNPRIKKKQFRIGGNLPIKQIVLLSLSKTVCILTASKGNREQTKLVYGISDESLKASSLYLSLYFEEADFIQEFSMLVFISIRDNNYKAPNLGRQGNR